MLTFTCERCGTEIENENLWFRCKLDSMTENLATVNLCENCYQTIKEVLEDGEIK